MLAPLKVHKILLIAILALVSHISNADESKLVAKDLQKPEVLIKALNKGFTSKQQNSAKKIFQKAQENENEKSWSAAAKHFKKSTLTYPTAKALIGLATAKAHLSKTAKRKSAITAIKKINGYLKSAIAVDKLQKKLSRADFFETKQEISCNNAFIASRKLFDNCGYVEVVFTKK